MHDAWVGNSCKYTYMALAMVFKTAHAQHVWHPQAYLNIKEVAGRAAKSALNKAEAAFHGARSFMLMCAALILIRLTP